jgi:methionine-rich copper-binding protein CopC
MRAMLIIISLLFGVTAASAHAFLDHAVPSVGSMVAHAPARLSLWFTEALEPAFSSITVRNAAGQSVDKGKAHVDRNNRMKMEVALKPLPPGTYQVHWHVLSVDTHTTQGNFSFTVGR